MKKSRVRQKISTSQFAPDLSSSGERSTSDNEASSPEKRFRVALKDIYLGDHLPMQLPLFWQVVFQESLRDRWILFPEKDIAQFRDQANQFKDIEQSDMKASLAKVLLHVRNSHTLSDVKATIANQSTATRYGVFRALKTFFDQWLIENKNLMN